MPVGVNQRLLEVRDPIHGAMCLSSAETHVVDHPFVQRLRNILSTGFSHLPFPGATHSRYCHSLGVMYLAGEAFDSAYRTWTFSEGGARDRFRAVVRLAALCHDLGHSPFSHCTEFAMPAWTDLGIQWVNPAEHAHRRATHEDYTVAILEQTDLAKVIQAHFPFTAKHVAALISPDVLIDDTFFVDGDLDHREILSQIISSELDVDRMDYLVRDSYFSGARYGQIDVGWLLSNLEAYAHDGCVSLALDSRAIYAFDDFMIARHHMFLMVYFHHKSVVYEEMLKRWVTSPDSGWKLPADMEAYRQWDDASLSSHLRTLDNPWARRVVDRRPYRRLLEVHGSPEEVDLTRQGETLKNADIDVIHAGSTGKLSRYNVFGKKRERAPAIYVVQRSGGYGEPAVSTLMGATQIFQRYADARRLARLYVAEQDLDAARQVLGLGM